MKALFLDFDGVLYDTLKEAYVLCRYVNRGIDVFAPIEEDIYKLFFRYKYLVYNSWQYLYLMKTLSDLGINCSDSDFIKRFNYYINKRDLVEESKFDEKYLEKRIWLIENYPDYVDSLEEKFSFLDMVKTLDRNEFDILVVSRKDSFAIKRKGINFKIIGKENLSNVINKAEFIEKYIDENNIEKAYFVDDNSHNLNPCLNIKNLTCLLAGWGNIGIDEIGLDAKQIFDTILGNY